MILLVVERAPQHLKQVGVRWTPQIRHVDRPQLSDHDHRIRCGVGQLRECHQGGVVLHEAWVDTGPRRWAKPRWVAADAGIAVPHRRALFGRWYLSSLISGERPGQPRRLTLQQPPPDNEVIVELDRNVGSFPAAVAGRLAALAAFGLLVHWLG